MSLPRIPNALCRTDASRRDFIRTTSGFAAAALASPIIGHAAEVAPSATSEALVTTFYKSLTAEQREMICFPFDLSDPDLLYVFRLCLKSQGCIEDARV